jgi:mannosyltransferase
MSLNRRSWKQFTPWALTGILVLALGLRLLHLTDRSLWFDEAFSWRLLQFPFREFLTRAAADVHPVLYYILLRWWAELLAQVGIDLSLFWLRFPSVLLSVGTVAAVAWAGRVLFRSWWAGLAAALLTAVNGFHIQYAWEARMYALGTLLLALAFGLLLHCSRERVRSWAWWYALTGGAVIGALLHTHYYTLFSVAALGLFTILFLIVRTVQTRGRTLGQPFTYGMLGMLLFGGVLFLPWVPVLLAQIARVESAFWIPALTRWSIANTMFRLLAGGVTEPSHLQAIIASLAVGVVLGVSLLRGRTRSDLLLVLSCIIPFLASWWVSQRTSVYQDRYFVFASVPLMLLLGRTLSFLPAKLRTAVLLVAVVASLGADVDMFRDLDLPHRPGAHAAADFLEEHAKPGEPILVSSSFAYFPMAFHLSTGTNREPPKLYSDTGQLGHFSGGPILTSNDLVGPGVFTSADRVWVVDTTGFSAPALAVPAPYRLGQEASFRELFPYQGEIIVREYRKENQ